MSLKSKVWTVAAAISVVEALKDQLGFCRWSHTITSMHHHARNNLKLLAQDATKVSSSSRSTSAIASTVRGTEKLRKSEESMKRVLQLSCWLPS